MSAEDALVSVLIPNFNHGEYLGHAIESAIRQSYRNIEIIVSDNASTDNSVEVIRNIQKGEQRIRLLENEKNLGPILNWKRCLDAANGKYVKFLFSDDYMESDFLEVAMPFLQNEEVGYFFSKIREFGDADITTYNLGRSGLFPVSRHRDGLLLYNGFYPVSPGCALFRTIDVRKNFTVGIPNRRGIDFCQNGYGTDALLFLNIGWEYKYFAYSNRPLAKFRGHKKSITYNMNFIEKDRSRHLLLYFVAKAHFVARNVKDAGYVMKFNSMLKVMLMAYPKNSLQLKKVADFYHDQIDTRVSPVYMLFLLVRITRNKMAESIRIAWARRRNNPKTVEAKA